MSLNQSFWKKVTQKFLVLLLGVLLFLTFSSLATSAQSRPAVTPAPPSTSSPATNTTGNAPKPDDLCGANLFQGACAKGIDQYATGDTETTVTNLTVNIITLLIYLGGAIAVFFIVLGGYKVITSNGEEKTAKEGRDMVINSVIGLIILLASFTIVTVTTSIFSNLDIGASE